MLEAPKANTSNLKVTLESIVQMFLQKLPLKIIVVRLPLSTHESLVTASSWACIQNFGDEFHHDPEADIGAASGVGAVLDHPWSVVIRGDADSSSCIEPIGQALVGYVSYPKPKVLRGHLTWRAGHITRVRV